MEVWRKGCEGNEGGPVFFTATLGGSLVHSAQPVTTYTCNPISPRLETTFRPARSEGAPSFAWSGTFYLHLRRMVCVEDAK